MPVGRLPFFTNTIFTDYSVSDARQIPASSGVTITVYRGGATATAAQTLTPGASGNIAISEKGFLRVGNTIFVGTDTSIVAVINSFTGETSVNVTASVGNSADFVVAIGSRLTPTVQPTLYKDPGGINTLSPVVVDSRGFYSFFADEEECDVLEAIGASKAKRVMPGLHANRLISHQADGASNSAHAIDTKEAWTLGKLWSAFNAGVEKVWITAVGLLRCVGFTSTAASSVTGGLTVDTLTVTSGSTFPAGDIALSELASTAFTSVSTISGTTLDSIENTAYELLDNLSISKAAAGASSVFLHLISLYFESNTAGITAIKIRIRNTTDGADVDEWLEVFRSDFGGSSIREGGHVTLHSVQTSPPTVAKTYEIQAQVTSGATNTMDLRASKHTYTIVEFKG